MSTTAIERSANDVLAAVRALHALEVIGDIDLGFAEAMVRIAREHDGSVALATALVSRQLNASHVCLDLPALCSGQLTLELPEGVTLPAWPALDAWLSALRGSALVGDARAHTPLYLDARGCLYLRRYFLHEQRLAAQLLARAGAPDPEVDGRALGKGLKRWFPPLTDGAPDLQRAAAERAVRSTLSVISGGPGTGKTSTVAKILALLIEQTITRHEPRPRIELLAPTGKAAARLGESIASQPDLPLDVRGYLPSEAKTVHRALGTLRGARRFRHGPDLPLQADVVVVDEASMIDLALMDALLSAVPAHARVILLGDENQLASVEAGSVLGDICGTGLSDAGSTRSPIAKHIVRLKRSYRYAPDSGIRLLADAVNAGDADGALALLADPKLADIALIEPAPGQHPLRALLADAASRFRPLFEAQGAAHKLQALGSFRVLCALRRGPYGQLAVNAAIEAALRGEGLIRDDSSRYPSRPILVTQNDHQAQLYNGDVGVLVRDELDPERVQACFAQGSVLRKLAPARLPPHESAYAMSVHKSQGSELDRVAVLLPDAISPVLCRELLYTAITRARSGVVIHAPHEVLRYAIGRRVERSSGLGQALWQPARKPMAPAR